MEQIFWVKAISETKQREINRQDGTKKMLSWHDVILTNGIDTIIGETSENLTAQMDNPNPDFKLDVKVDDCVMVRATFSVMPYEKDGRKSHFQKCIINQMVIV